MAMRDEDFGAALTPVEADDGHWSPPIAAPARGPHDWQSLYEEAHARAERERARAGRGGRARGGAAPGGDGCPFPCGFAEVAARQELGQAQGGRRGDEGGPPRGEGRAVLPGGSDAAGEAPFGGRCRFVQAQHDRVAAYGSRPAAQDPGAGGGAEGRARGVAQEGRDASPQVETSGTGFAAPESEPPAAQGAGTRAQAEGHDQGVARGSRFPEPGGPPAAPRAGAIAGPQGDSPPADLRNQAAARGAGGIPRPDGPHRCADEARRQSGNRPAAIRSQGGAGGRARRASSGVRALRKTARPGQDHRVAAQGKRTAGREDQGVARPQSEPASPDCPAPLDASRVVEGGLRRPERAAGDAALGPRARPAARRSRARPHPAADARGEGGTAGAAGGRAHVLLLRQALCRERRAFLVRHRDRGQGPYPQDRAPALPPGLRLRVLAPGSDGAPRRRGCSPGRPTGPASGRASSSSGSPACGPCDGSRRG